MNYMLAKPKVLILTVPHGASHRTSADALRSALLEVNPALSVEVVDALRHCTAWFRAYYNSYEIPLKYWPSLWGWIEGVQHQSQSTGPIWLYRRGAKPLYRFIEGFGPDVVVANEVGICEIAALHKRYSGARHRLVGVELMDFNQAWVQAEVDLYLVSHEDLGAELISAGAAKAKIVCSGLPLRLTFAALPPRDEARARLRVEHGIPLLLVLFGGTGFGKPRQIVAELKRLRVPVQTVFITGKNQRLESELRCLANDLPRACVLGWVDNVHEWMLAADLMISKPGGSTLMEGFACGLPMLAHDPLPGNEQRTCAWIERWGAGCWVRRTEDLGPTIERLLTNPEELASLRERARALAKPRAAFDGAQAILRLLTQHGS
jgi:processive 1,2-diacylglycerol beta-glucosyltransferase